MEFTLADFTNRIHQVLYDNFPYENDTIDIKKHKNRPLHIRDIALLPPMESDGALVFEIGSEYAEENYPYYHILEDAEVIRKRGKGNKQSGGSQAKIEKLGKVRDSIIGENNPKLEITMSKESLSQSVRMR